ncbi:MAG TPA: chitobiase/beta-hexosaminidase C-terminal domain-containing protein, partial [Spirochaetia bacterium]|nr:chitobiase/beta-hexosaminidase C-terminal domain-containing protein [Spirochaetia bacterium]
MRNHVGDDTRRAGAFGARALAVIGAAALSLTLTSCPPNSLLTDVKAQVEAAQQSGQNQGTVAAPAFTPSTANGTYTSSTDLSGSSAITITCATAGAAIHYTTDGSTPSVSTATYTGPISITQAQSPVTIKAVGTRTGWTDSPMTTMTYVVNYNAVSTPTFNPAGPATFTTATDIQVSTTTSGAYIQFTTDGSMPTASGGS